MSSYAVPAGGNVIRYRWLLYELVVRNLILRYRGSVLGFAWTLLNPLLFMAVYALVFGVILKLGRHNYPIYLLSGIMAWNWFVNAVQSGTSAIIDGRMYVGKTVFPAELLVIVPVLSNAVNFLLSLPFLVIVVLAFHQPLGWALLMLPVLILAQTILTTGLLFFLATLNVFFRDLQQLIQLILMLAFFLIPIFYSIDAVAVSDRKFIYANPVAILIMGYQHIFYYNQVPGPVGLLYLYVVSIVLLIAGYATFLHYKEALGEYL